MCTRAHSAKFLELREILFLRKSSPASVTRAHADRQGSFDRQLSVAHMFVASSLDARWGMLTGPLELSAASVACLIALSLLDYLQNQGLL